MTVVLPTFDRAQFVPEAINSVIEQTVSDWELIIVDDGSTDGTEEAIGEFLADARVRYWRQPHQGCSTARNTAVEMARGEIVCFLDSDDSYLPNALQTHLDARAATPDAAMTIAGYDEVDETGVVTASRRPWLEIAAPAPEEWLFDCFAIPGSVAIRRDWLARVGGFAPEVEWAEDWDLFLRLAFAGCPMAWAPSVVCRYRHHDSNASLAFARHLAAAQLVLDRLFATTDVPLPLAERARAWTYAVYARRAARAGEDGQVRDALTTAIALHAIPNWSRRRGSLAPEGTALLLEGLVADVLERGATNDATDPARLAARWGVSAAVVRRAIARVAAARFFAAASGGEREEARARLRTALAHDPRWIVNPAVASFLTRELAARIRGRA